MKIALRRYVKGDWVDFGINAFSGFGGFCHAELVFPHGVSYSSTSRFEPGDEKPDGTRFAYIDYDKHPERWAFVDFHTTSVEESVVYSFCLGELECRYDFAGCVRFGLPFWKEHKDKWFCSEVCVAALQQIGYLMDLVPHKTSPNHLAKKFNVR